MSSDSSCQTIIDKFLELINTPNMTDTGVVVEMINYLGLRISYKPDAKWVSDSSHTTVNEEKEQ